MTRRVDGADVHAMLAMMASHQPSASLVLVLVAVLGNGRVHADDKIAVSTDRSVTARLPDWLHDYEDLHAHPELALKETRTAGVVARRLAKLGYQVTANVGGTGVVGMLENGRGPTLLLRADMDGLPVAEKTGLRFASQQRGIDESRQEVPVMHACGHDVHVTNLLASAELLAADKKGWSGTLLLVAQPAEETGEGALRMIRDGLFERFPKPDSALALHVDPELPVGQVGAISGWAAANADSVDIKLFGRGGHGARPQATVDPVVIAAHLVVALQTLVSRRVDPQSPAVVTVGSIHGGTKRSIIPDEVELQLTVRSYDDETRSILLDGIAQLARDVSATFRAPKPPLLKVKTDFTPAVWNDPALTERVKTILTQALGAAAIGSVARTLTAEDFGRYGKQLGIPSVLLRLGVTPKRVFEAQKRGGPQPPALHSAEFAPDVAHALPVAVRATTSLVRALLPAAPNDATKAAPRPGSK